MSNFENTYETMDDLYERHKHLNDAWLGLDFRGKNLNNPLINIPDQFNNPEQMPLYISWLMTRPEYLYFICKEIFGVTLFTHQSLMFREFWNKKFPMLVCSRGWGKSSMLALYAMLRALLLPGRKIAICGAAYRQSKVLFGYMNGWWEKSPLLRNIVRSLPGKDNGPFRGTDICGFRIGDSVINCFPLGDGEKIRGQRANDVIADEFGAINREIFETVIAGFAIVSSDPLQKAKDIAAIKMAQREGIVLPADIMKTDEFSLSNQIIISGTAYYATSHFAEYWKMWKARILSRGDMEKYYKALGKDIDAIPEEELKNDSSNHYNDYCIIRTPYDKVPEGFMDDGQINRARATISRGAFETEYGAVFSKDSDGFFKHSAIDAATTAPNKRFFSFRDDGGFSHFTATKYGRRGPKYVMGVDPASELDRFSIVILEIHPDHKRIVYGWSTNRAEQKAREKDLKITKHNYYTYCAMKIRELKKQFNVERIAIDAGSGGGGTSILEALSYPENLKEDELPFFEIIDDDKEKDSDFYQGEHILEMVNFSSAWISEANHSLKKDITDQRLLFPYYDTTSLILDGGMSMDDREKTYDTLEDVFDEIEELKDELMTIVCTLTPSGKEKFDTPEQKLANGKKGRQRKDRYSALLLANMAARAITPGMFQELERTASGGFATGVKSKNQEQLGYKVAPEWMKNSLDLNTLDLYGPI